ncbi:hypothetical protein [Spirosoma fluviale]|uniref:DUF3784 domain-containing protein n=1 Tax=Spirosoma fluviale TaxID=1597977 RepID=A0A286FFM7_9BACT|nr:hypothetical protein [Spirosoma fluviale]SOD81614.1 hypothetical protein SAMN06269250_1851 [Spirosoma fluviale]
MNILMLCTGIGLALLGAGIWRYKATHLLSNVDSSQVDPSRKGDLARYAGLYCMGIGGIFLGLAFVIERFTTEKELLFIIGGTVVVIMIATAIYLSGLGRFMKK